MMEDKSSLTFSFCGDYEVNATSLCCAITSLVEISETIAEIEFPDVDFDMSVRAMRPGSLIFDFVATADFVKNMLTKDNIEFAAALLSGVSSAFAIKQFLKGENPKSVKSEEDTITIENPEGSKIIVPKTAGAYFINSNIDLSVTNAVKSAGMAKGVTGLKIQAENNTVEIPKAEFEECSKRIEINDDEHIRTFIRERETLFIRQPDFSGGLKWKFTGVEDIPNITASMLDDSFNEHVQKGEIAFTGKTYIIADIRVKRYLNLDGSPSAAKPSYEVLKVHDVCTAGEGQTKLNV